MSRRPVSIAEAFNLERGGHLEPVVPPRPDPASGGASCAATRVVQAGGILAQLLSHPIYTPWEQLYRKLPEQGMFQATPERNFKFELGAYQVPANYGLLVIDYRFDIYRLSGAVAGDTVPIEARRLSTLLAYDWKISASRMANLRMEIDPVPIQATKEAYVPQATGGVIASGSGQINNQDASLVFAPSSVPQRATQAQFNLANFARSTTPGGLGLSGLPQRTSHLGPLALPFNAVIPENDTIQFEVVIFRGIPIPIAFFELDVTGLLIPMNVINDMMDGMKPCVSQGGGR